MPSTSYPGIGWEHWRESTGVSPYLIAIIGDYFRNRINWYISRGGQCMRESDVVWAFVLDSLMWKLTYDVILKTASPPPVAE